MSDALDCEKAAIRLLARREHSRRELWHKLNQRGFDSEIIDTVLDRLREEDWQSDDRYAESYVRARVERGYGPDRIAAELRQRGVDEHRAARAVADAEVDWSALARRQLYRHFSRPPADFDERVKRYRHLVNRGFAPELARSLDSWWPRDDLEAEATIKRDPAC